MAPMTARAAAAGTLCIKAPLGEVVVVCGAPVVVVEPVDVLLSAGGLV